jgi:hypothetical protein
VTFHWIAELFELMQEDRLADSDSAQPIIAVAESLYQPV